MLQRHKQSHIKSTNSSLSGLLFVWGTPVKGQIITTNSAATFADGVACKVPQEAAMEVIWQGCERIVRVSEEEIREAIIALYKDTHNIAEGAGAAAFAALMKEREKMASKRVGVILSGGNIDLELFTKVITNQPL